MGGNQWRGQFCAPSETFPPPQKPNRLPIRCLRLSLGHALPKIEKPRGNSNGAAIVELLKVLLRMTSERHAVASKVIATVDDLDQIAADDNADVAALHGWRRELFGEAAIALKHGRLALAIEKGRVVRVDRA